MAKSTAAQIEFRSYYIGGGAKGSRGGKGAYARSQANQTSVFDNPI